MPGFREGSVEHQVSEIGDVGEQPLFRFDGLQQVRGVICQRVAPAGFAEAFDQGAGEGIKEDHFAVHQRRVDAGVELRKRIEIAAAGVDADSIAHLGSGAVGQGVGDQGGEQLYRKVIDAAEARIFQRAQGRGFTRAGASADDDQLHAA
jgi:hypothetical protein